jgi:glycosyltransferase involved in cell wall biosynthesis
MYKNKKIVVVMPAYNAEKTLRQAFAEVCEQDIVDTVIIVDDCSRDNTVVLAEEIKNKVIRQSGSLERSGNHSTNVESVSANNAISVHVHRHERNMGYGGYQKSCYKLALEHGADIVIMVHPDCQYTPKLIPAMASMIANELHPCVLGSRILGGYALKGGMPIWKYVFNRWLTLAMNILFGAKLSEYHTGYRAFSRELLEKLPLEENMDDFAFDAQMLAEILWTGATIGEVSCPTVYFEDASSISFARSCAYGIGCLKTALLFRLCKWGVIRSKKFQRMH